MKRWNIQKPETTTAATATQQWTAIIDGILFISFKSYEDLMEKIREYRESK